MPDLCLRKVTHPQANNNYRVILKIDETEYEIGSIGTQYPPPRAREKRTLETSLIDSMSVIASLARKAIHLCEMRSLTALSF